MKSNDVVKPFNNFFSPPVFPRDEAKTRRARLLHALLVGSMLLLGIGGGIAIAFLFVEKIANSIVLAVVLVIAYLAYRLLRSGRVRAASILFLYGLWPVFTLIIFFSGGALSVISTFFIVLVMIAGFLLGFRGALLYSGICCLSGFAMVLLEASGYSLPLLFPIPPVVGLLDLAVVLFMTTLTMHFAIGDLNTALAKTRRRLEQRQQAEKELRESEERFARMSSAAFEGIGITDAGRIIDANPQLAQMLGYLAEELIGMQVMDFIAPESRALVAANIRAGIEGPYEHMAQRKDGTLFPVVIRARSIPYKGRTVRVSVIRDITERKRTEEDIARQLNRMRALHTIEQVITSSTNLPTVLGLLARQVVAQLHMDAATILLYEEDEKQLLFSAGEGFRTEALRFTRLEIGAGLAGKAALTKQIVHIKNLADLEDNPTLAETLSGEGFVEYFGVPLIAKGRLCGVMEILLRSPFAQDADWLTFLETLAGQAAIAIDNARLLEMTQTNLKETEALYRITRQLTASIEPFQLMQEVVSLLRESFGYSYVQIYVRDPETSDFVLRAGSGETGEELIRRGHRLRAGEGIVGYTAETDAPFLTNDVEKVIVFRPNPLLPEVKSELAVPIRIGGKFLGLLDIQQVPPSLLAPRDVQLVSAVADQLAVALQKAQLYADLQSALRQEEEARAQLVQSEKLAVTGRLMASVSHELNNPLQAIQNVLFLLKEEKKMSPQARKDLDVILEETERMAAMLDRLRTTYQPVRAEDFHLLQVNKIIADVHALIATHLRHARITFKFHADPGLPLLSGIRDQLRQVILNLFMNAVDAMPDGGRLTVSTEDLLEDGEILIRISDTGEGIPSEIQPHLFEHFISGKEKGTGLGLAICHEIISHHNGRIRAENNKESGATFSVWLPVAKEGGP